MNSKLINLIELYKKITEVRNRKRFQNWIHSIDYIVMISESNFVVRQIDREEGGMWSNLIQKGTKKIINHKNVAKKI